MKHIIFFTFALLVFTSPASAQVPSEIMPGVCEDIHGATADTVTLGKGGINTLREAHAALRPEGGVILVPYNDGKVYQDNDDYIYGGNNGSVNLTIRGVLGPNGEKPKFKRLGGAFVSYGTRAFLGGKPGPASKNWLLIENLEVEGYVNHIRIKVLGGLILKNNYFHHAAGNGINIAGMSGEQTTVFEACNNEFSHSGRGNTKHILYIHRGMTETSWVRATFVNNYCHSARGSHCYKSVANQNIIIGNVFATNPTNDMEPTYYGTTLTDLAGCANNVVANNSYFLNTFEHGVIGVDFRGRRSILGCDRPPYDSDQFRSDSFWGRVSEAGLGVFAPDYASSGNPMLFHSYVSGNSFVGLGGRAHKTTAIVNFGIFPTKIVRSFGNCVDPLPVPEGYVERTRVWVANNSYESVGNRYVERTDNFCDPSLVSVERGPIIEIGGEDGTPIVLPGWFLPVRECRIKL